MAGNPGSSSGPPQRKLMMRKPLKQDKKGSTSEESPIVVKKQTSIPTFQSFLGFRTHEPEFWWCLLLIQFIGPGGCG